MSSFDAITVTLNPAIDRALVIADFAAGAVNRVEHTIDMAGGKGVNVASALADFGWRVASAGFLGSENDGIFNNHFQRKGIGDEFIRIAGSTRVGLKIVDPQARQTTDINFPGLSPTAEEFQALTARLERLDLKPGGWLALCGSLPPGLPQDAYAKLVRMAKERGWNTLVDTSGEPLRCALAAAPTVIKPNVEELETLVGRALSDLPTRVESAREMVQQGVELAVVSMGAQGALFVTADRVILARAPEVEVVGTVGAGDAMAAGVISAQMQGLPLEQCARLAAAFSMVRVTRGYHEARFEPQSLEPWLEKTGIQQLSS